MNAKIDLPGALLAWNTDTFAVTLKHDIEVLGAAAIGLDRCLTGFGIIDKAITVIVLGADDQDEVIEARIMILYTVIETLYCCPDCSGEDAVQKACEMTVYIRKSDAASLFIASPSSESLGF
ncbi:MAG: hypothetical protein NNA19_09590 [Nitrospira sp.]|nr:hypothetical protein [Nitrospira sp.]MCP9475480.1 hypothetical protein [Nitrospira sp.]